MTEPEWTKIGTELKSDLHLKIDLLLDICPDTEKYVEIL